MLYSAGTEGFVLPLFTNLVGLVLSYGLIIYDIHWKQKKKKKTLDTY